MSTAEETLTPTIEIEKVEVPAPPLDGRHGGERSGRAGPRARTLSTEDGVRAVKRAARALERAEEDDPLPPRPQTRADCMDAPRPCPWVACKWNLYLDVNERTGAVKLNFPHLEPWEMTPTESCALDVADAGALTLEDVGVVMNLTRERIRQLEEVGRNRMGKRLAAALADDE